MRRSALSKVTLSLLALGLLGGGLIACGDDPAPAPTQTGDGDSGDGDNGDGDKGDGDGDAAKDCMKLGGTSLEVQQCKTDDDEAGFKICKNGKPSGECKTQAELVDADSGAFADICIDVPQLSGKYAMCKGGKYQKCTDEGEPTGNCKTLTELISAGDGGIPDFGDAGAAAKACPTSGGFTCGMASALGMQILPQKTCNVPALGGLGSAPPSDSACTATGTACTTMGLAGNCVTGLPVIGSVYVQQCP